jgi:hypothetical protein
MKRKVIFFLFFFLAIFFLVFLNVSVANPASGPFYSLKRLYEKTQLSLKSSPKDKLSYQCELLDKRLTELVFIVEKGVSPAVLSSSLRYSTTAGQITELIINNDLTDEAKIAEEKFETHLSVVESLPQKYTGDESETKFITDDANYLRVYIDQLSSFSSKN